MAFRLFLCLMVALTLASCAKQADHVITATTNTESKVYVPQEHIRVYEFHLEDGTRCLVTPQHSALVCDFN